MSLDAILEAIRQSGKASVRAIEARASEEVARIMVEGKAEAEAVQQEAREAASRAMTADQARIIHHAQLEAMQIVGHAEQTIVEQALAGVETRLAELRTATDYPEFLHDLVQEALAALQGSLRENEQGHLYADPRDRAMLDEMLRDMRLDVQVSYELESWGGIRATSADHRVVVDNTLEARLSFATPLLQRILPKLLKRDTETGSALREVDRQSSNL